MERDAFVSKTSSEDIEAQPVQMENKKSPVKGIAGKQLLQNASQNEPFTKIRGSNENQSPSSTAELDIRIQQRATSTGQGQRFNRTRK